MTAFILTHSAFFDARHEIQAPAATRENGPVLKGEVAAADAVRRYTNAGATDAKVTELTAAEHRAIVLKRLPQLAQ